jgi:hypothetical protein
MATLTQLVLVMAIGYGIGALLSVALWFWDLLTGRNRRI